MGGSNRSRQTRNPRIGVSSCLLGNAVRYDGGHKRSPYLTDTLGRFVDWIPVCPEVECGLPVPREPMRLVETDKGVRLMTRDTGVDQTDNMHRWIRKKLRELAGEHLDGFIFKSRSPSSGMQRVNIYSASGHPVKKGAGLFASAFINAFPNIPCEDDGRLEDPGLRENFIDRVIVMSRWNAYLGGNISVRGLMDFHTRVKYLLMSHSQKHYKELGQLVAGAKRAGLKKLHDTYIDMLMDGLRLMATVKKNTNVLQHIMGYFKDALTSDEKAELLEVIGRYHDGLVPLVVPVTLLNHYVRKYDRPYLRDQFYLDPSPSELMLRNHV